MPVFNNSEPTRTHGQEQVRIALRREISISIEQFSPLLGQIKLSAGCIEIKISCFVAMQERIYCGIICTVNIPPFVIYPRLRGFFSTCSFFLIMHLSVLEMSALVNCCLGSVGKKSQELFRPHKQNKQPLDSDSYTQTTSKYKLPSH